MKKLFFTFAVCFCAYAAHAEDAYEKDTIAKQTAVVRIMNKAAGRAQTVTLPVGVPFEYDRLSITVRACRASAPYSARDDFMFVQVEKKSARIPQDAKVFSGWMMSSDPGYNPLQDPDYDLWLVRCE